LKAQKINNAAWIPILAPHIEKFCKRAHVDGIQPGNFQTYLAQIAQFGGDRAEFWVVFEDDEPVAFAEWEVLGLPHIAKVYCLACNSWTKDKTAVDLLTDEFVKFGQRHRAVWWSADFVGKGNVRLFERKMKQRGFQMLESNVINCVFRRS
jgi:hypothetical protein